MKFTKFGKALLLGALTTGASLCITSCVSDYTVGFLYVTGTETSSTSGQGIISGYKIAHNTGRLSQINGLPVASGGANPIRAVLLSGGRFLYVLNRGTNSEGTAKCTTEDPCTNSNITLFSVGSNGVLSEQATYYSQGTNPFRMISDSGGSFLYVLDHDAPNKNGECAAALGSGYTKCGDITAFKIDSSTGRLSLLQDQQVATSTNAQATYFPIPSNPVDFTLASSTLLTLSDSNGEATATPYAGNYTGGNTVFPYTYSSTSGQLTVTSSGVQTLGSSVSANAIVYSSGGYVYVLDNEKTSINGTVYYSQIIPYTQGSNGSLQAQTGGPVGIDTTMMNPTALVVESKGKWAYVASASGSGTTNASSGISGYVLDTSTKQLTFMSGEPFGSGSGPLCIVEDPSDQFIYTVNYNDSTISGRILDQSSGVLNNISGTSQWTLSGPPTWAVMDGRTD